MKKIIFLFFLLAFQITASAQHDTVVIVRSNTLSGNEPTADTFLFDSPMLGQVMIGTCIIPSSTGQIISWGRGVDFEKVTKTDCMSHGDEVYSQESRINDFTLTDTSLVVDMTLIENCCYEFLCDIMVDDEGILHLNYTGYGSFCGCMCCFGVQYQLNLDRTSEDYNLKGIMLGNDEKTLRKIN